MKKIIFLTVLVCGILASCGTSKTVRTSKKIMKGEWTLNDVSYDKYGTFRITFFDDATKDCMIGSDWKFIPNNNTGIYTINNANCITGNRDFIFTIDEINEETGLYDFLLKPVDGKGKSASNRGYRLKLIQLSDTNMVWEQAASLDGKTINMTLKFSKKN
ncbi:lipocalin family protein [Lutibacter citreus]|uniref:lipocalin family protein n=1 Tax=Lutibacter citreus TaxID=2138210 RepID=UPI000DBE1030|nr:lipocalin family protein [Lutibacter citreus]